MSDNQEEQAKKEIRKIVREEMKLVLDNYKFEFEMPKEVGATGQEKRHEEEIFEDDCPNCGTKTKKTDRYCPTCGSEFED